MAQNLKENFWPQQISLDVVLLETSSAFETGWVQACILFERANIYRRLLKTKLFRAAQVIIACVYLSPVHMKTF